MPTAFGSPGDGRSQSERGGELEGADGSRSDNLQHMSSVKFKLRKVREAY
jgi:hypothetical protein